MKKILRGLLARRARDATAGSRWGRAGAPLAAALLVGLAAACDAEGRLPLGLGTGSTIRSGSYDYTAWSDRYRDVAWWGTVDIRIHSGGTISGVYRLPRQCSDRFGPGADCVGRIGGRVQRDGTIRLGFDEGWLSHDGALHRSSSTITGLWWTKLLGHRDDGTFELRRF